MAGIETYTYYNAPEGPITVNRIDDSGLIVEDHAIAMLSLLNKVYSDTFETPKGPAPKGYFREYFDPQDIKKVDEELKLMKSSVANIDAQIYYVKGRAFMLPWVAALRATPSRNTKDQLLGLEGPDLLINDIVADPPGHKRGAAILHALVTESGYSNRSKVIIHAHNDASRAAAWYEELGIERQGALDTKLKLGSVALSMSLNSTGEGGVALVRQRLEEINPWLKKRHPCLPEAA